MTVTNQVSSISFQGNGVTTSFAFPGPFFALSDLLVTLTNQATGIAVTPSPVLNGAGTYDYEVSGTQDTASGEYLSGGTVVFNTAPPATFAVSIQRQVPATQNVSLTDNSLFPAKSVEGGLDRLTMLVQQVLTSGAHTLSVPAVDSAPLLVFPAAAARAGLVAGFDAAGNVTLYSPSSVTVIPSMPLSLTSFGAVGDGVTDNTTAFTNFINALQSQKIPGFIPQGIFNIAAGVVITSAISLSGAGMQLSTIHNTNAALNAPIIHIDASGSTGSLLSGFSISSVAGTGASCAGIQIDGGQQFGVVGVNVSGTNLGISVPLTQSGAWIDRCFVTNTGGNGISVDAGNMVITDCYALNCGGVGFNFSANTGGSGGLIVKGCTAFNSGSTNFSFQGNSTYNISDLVVSNCVASSSPNGNGFFFNTYGNYIAVSNLFCELAGMTQADVFSSGQDGILFTPNNSAVTVSNCVVIGASYNGLSMNCSNFSVTGGYFVNNNGAYQASASGIIIGLSGAVVNFTISGVNTSVNPGGSDRQRYGVDSYTTGNIGLISNSVLHGTIAAFYNSGSTATFANNLSV